MRSNTLTVAAALAASASAASVTLSTKHCADLSASSAKLTVELGSQVPIPIAAKPACGLAIESVTTDINVDDVVCHLYTDATPPQLQPGELVKNNGEQESEVSQSLIQIGPVGAIKCTIRNAKLEDMIKEQKNAGKPTAQDPPPTGRRKRDPAPNTTDAPNAKRTEGAGAPTGRKREAAPNSVEPPHAKRSDVAVDEAPANNGHKREAAPDTTDAPNAKRAEGAGAGQTGRKRQAPENTTSNTDGPRAKRTEGAGPAPTGRKREAAPNTAQPPHAKRTDGAAAPTGHNKARRSNLPRDDTDDGHDDDFNKRAEPITYGSPTPVHKREEPLTYGEATPVHKRDEPITYGSPTPQPAHKRDDQDNEPDFLNAILDSGADLDKRQTNTTTINERRSEPTDSPPNAAILDERDDTPPFEPTPSPYRPPPHLQARQPHAPPHSRAAAAAAEKRAAQQTGTKPVPNGRLDDAGAQKRADTTGSSSTIPLLTGTGTGGAMVTPGSNGTTLSTTGLPSSTSGSSGTEATANSGPGENRVPSGGVKVNAGLMVSAVAGLAVVLGALVL